MGERYLYGASVQGIQSFIFKTNKLKEIIGASEIVEQICTTEFYKISGFGPESSEIILSAAGNVKCVLTEEQCRKLVLKFPMEIQKIAPGITISQAVIKYNEGEEIPIQKLENLLKIQRNILSNPLEIGFMGLERDRRSGGIAFEVNPKRNGGDEFISEATSLKRNVVKHSKEFENELSKEKLFEKISGLKNVPNRELSFDIENITDSGNNSWIAVIHADGNGLGNLIQNRAKELSVNKEYKLFSSCIEVATKSAVQKAFQEVIGNDKKQFEIKHQSKKKYTYPIRPVVLGGDDLTVIIRADLAISFTESFLREFEKATKDEFSTLKTKNILGLTACAGIAFIKKSYPLHYGLNLADELCQDAKKASRTESSFAFYKVQESFVEHLETLKRKTLKTNSNLSYYAGPYNLEKVKILMNNLTIIKKEADRNDKTKGVGNLRQIVSETYKDKSTAIFMMKRMEEINSEFYKALKLEKEIKQIEEDGTSQLVDLITLHSFNYGN